MKIYAAPSWATCGDCGMAPRFAELQKGERRIRGVCLNKDCVNFDRPFSFPLIEIEAQFDQPARGIFSRFFRVKTGD